MQLIFVRKNPTFTLRLMPSLFRLSGLTAFVFLSLLLPIAFSACSPCSAGVESYRWAPSLPSSGIYTVSVLGVPQHVIPTEEPHICQFGCSDSVEVVVSLIGERIRSAAVRPLYKKVSCEVKRGKLHFKMAPYDQFVVELNGLEENPLFVFANPKENKPPRDSCAYYFAAGSVVDTTLQLTSGKVYFEAGSWVNGLVHVFDAHDVEIAGYGVLCSNGKERPMFIKNSQRVSVDGILLINRDMWSTLAVSSQDVRFSNYKVVAPASGNAHGHENDALDILGCQGVRVRGCFTYCHDDALCIKSQKWNWASPVRDVVCEDCTIWNYHCGSGIEIGWETNQDCSDVHFKNIWCVRSGGDMNPEMNRAGISVKHCAGGHLSDFTFENIYVEDALEYGIYFGIYQSTANIGNRVEWSPGTMDGFVFRNIHIDGPVPYGSASDGYDDADHAIKGVRFEGLYLNGEEVGPDPSRFFGRYVHSDISIQSNAKLLTY